MKNISLFLALTFLAFPFYGQNRYKNEVFTGIDSVMNIPYGMAKTSKGEDQILTLDVYQPKLDTLKKRPLVVFIHGGGFVNGDKRTGYSKTVSENLTKRGFVVASINYRLGVEAPRSDMNYFEAMMRAVQDGKAAIRFMRKNAQKWGIDTSKIVVSGGSAGGMTALHLAYLDQNEVPADFNTTRHGTVEGSSGNDGISSKVHAVVNFWGSMANVHWIKPNDIPVFNVHGTADKTVPFDSSYSYHGFKHGSLIVYEQALRLGIPTGIKLSEGLGHTLDNNQTAIRTSLDEVAQWLYAFVHQSKSSGNINRFSNEIEAFEQDNQSKTYSNNALLFTGSSYIRLWKTIQKDLAPAEIIHRGFGGSRIAEMAYFVPRIVYGQQPKAIFMYSGSNDLSGSIGDKSPAQILACYQFIVKTIRIRFPKVPIYYIAISPNEKRWAVWDKIQETNDLIDQYSRSNPNLFFIKTAKQLLGPDGKYQPNLYIADKLHFNAKGYEIWTSTIRQTIENMP
jgi:lysophospholipase L1-like esterase/alpha/beta superfamily hydrolase